MLNEHMRAQMREATRTLMSGGAAAATAAIQKVLKGMPGDSGAAISPMPDFLRDMTMPDMNFTSGKTFGVDDAMPDFVTDLLAQLGLPSVDTGCGTGKNPWQPQPEIQPADEAQSDAKGGGQFLNKSFTNHAGTRSYKLYVPSSYHGQAMPLIVMLHGCTQNPDDFANGTRMNAVADERQCLVVYPAQAQSANSSRCWNWFKSVDQHREQGEPSIIAGITREIIRNYKVDASKVYVAGLSSGGAMAVIMATTYPDLYAAVGVHSGLPYASARDLPSAFAAMRGSVPRVPGPHPQDKSPTASRTQSIPIIVFHGDRDTTVNARNGEKLMEQNASEFVCDGHSAAGHTRPDVIVEEGKVPNGHRYTRTSHHDEGGHAIAEHWVIHGAGHAWSGGSKSGSYTDAKGPDATREMIRFFYAKSQTKQVI
jgi:poly(hydroxyalkanoate) depolymerase family esterase